MSNINNSGKIKNNPNNRLNPVTRRWENQVKRASIPVDRTRDDISAEYNINDPVKREFDTIDYEDRKYSIKTITELGYWPTDEGTGYKEHNDTKIISTGTEENLLHKDELAAVFKKIPDLTINDTIDNQLVQQTVSLLEDTNSSSIIDNNPDGLSESNHNKKYSYQHIQLENPSGDIMLASIVNVEKTSKHYSEDDIGFSTTEELVENSTVGIILNDGGTRRLVKLEEHNDLPDKVNNFIDNGIINGLFSYNSKPQEEKEYSRKGFFSRIFGRTK